MSEETRSDTSSLLWLADMALVPTSILRQTARDSAEGAYDGGICPIAHKAWAYTAATAFEVARLAGYTALLNNLS